MSKRVTYEPITGEPDYVDARFAVILDGEKVAEVVRDEVSKGSSAGGARYFTSTWTATEWEVEADGYRAYGGSKTRMDAVIDYLTSARRMSYQEARDAVGKRGI